MKPWSYKKPEFGFFQQLYIYYIYIYITILDTFTIIITCQTYFIVKLLELVCSAFFHSRGHKSSYFGVTSFLTLLRFIYMHTYQRVTYEWHSWCEDRYILIDEDAWDCKNDAERIYAVKVTHTLPFHEKRAGRGRDIIVSCSCD